MITAQDTEQITKALGAFLDARANARRFHAERIGRGVDPHHCLADFLCLVRRGDTDALWNRYQAERTKAAMAESSGALGGYLVPADLRETLYQAIEEEAIVRPRATVVPMSTAALRLPLPDPTVPQSAGVPPYFGGFSLDWTAEAATRTETEPAWSSVDLQAWELSGVCYASNNFLADATPGTEAFLTRLFARSVAWAEDRAFLQGDGVGKPLGLRNAPCALAVNRASANDFKFADAAGMVAKLLPACWSRAVWVVFPTAVEKLVGLATTTTATWQANMPSEPGAPVGFLHTRPVFASDKVPALGTAGDVVLFDPLLYVIGDRQQVEVAASPHAAFLSNQTVFRVLARLDGRPWLRRAVTLADGASTASSIVYLN